MDNLNEDGSRKDRTFTEVEGIEYPHPKIGIETYKEYFDRVKVLKEKGFHLGDLSQNDYVYYCDGGGCTSVDENTIIE